MIPGTIPTVEDLIRSGVDADAGRGGPNAVYPFLLGTAVGGVAGAVVGTLLGHQVAHLVAALIGVVDRRLTASERDELRFELLLQ